MVAENQETKVQSLIITTFISKKVIVNQTFTNNKINLIPLFKLFVIIYSNSRGRSIKSEST
jgi:hypothetical protein